MDPTVSVSKGVFVFNNAPERAPKRTNTNTSKFKSNAGNIYSDELWYKTYSCLWKSIETKIQNLNSQMLAHLLRNLIQFITSSYNSFVSEIPAAALLTGINMPDHASQYTTLADEIKTTVTPHVVCLNAEDSQSVRCLIENMVYQFINENEQCLSSSDDECDMKSVKVIKKSQCNLSLLQAWYEDLYYNDMKNVNQSPVKKQKVKDDSKVLVVIISDFEGFSPKVLQEFILIASSYLNILPFVFIFGIATSLAVLHKTLPYNVMSKINVEVFNSPSSGDCLNKVLEEVLFRCDVPFRLGGKVFNLFTEIFLFYNISVTSFVQNYKYAMLEHFSQSNATALCCKVKFLCKNLKQLSHEDLEDLRHFLTFRRLVENESYENRIKLINDDEYFREVLKKEILKIHHYINLFGTFLKCLHILVSDLPKAPLGKHVREIYSIATTRNLVNSNEYKECFDLLNMQSREELFYKICKILSFLNEQIRTTENETKAKLQTFWESINNYMSDLNMLNISTYEFSSDEDTSSLTTVITNRHVLKERLLDQLKKPLSTYEKIRTSLLNHLTKAFKKYLHEPHLLNFYEIFFFDDLSIQDHIVGANRAAIHTALVDPHSYIKCICCEIPNDSKILKTMPDICIVYKLHLEYGKLINLYDWLQAFLSIMNPDEESDDDSGGKTKKQSVDPNLQARFTQAVAELEYLGFIKSSKRKTDHVTRLTWGGC